MNVTECTDCSRTSDAKHFECPPRMADGRHFTDYRPRCAINYSTSLTETPVNSYESRQFMIHHAGNIIENNREIAYSMNRCGACVEPFNVGTMHPEQSKVTCNKSFCTTNVTEPNGLGQGRVYGGDKSVVSSEESEFIKKRSQDMNIKNCCTTSKSDMDFYPIDGIVRDTYGRFAVPGGGAPLSGTSRTSHQ